MSATKCQNQDCGAETSNGLAMCERCTHTLRVALTNTAAYYADALRIVPGQRVRVRGAYQSTPPPSTRETVDPISAATDYVDNIILGWARNLSDDRPTIEPFQTNITTVCGWLESHVGSIVTLEWAGECLREIQECERLLQRLIDRSDTGWYAGICANEVGRETDIHGEIVALECPRQLYGTQSSSWVTCPECGRAWDASTRRDAMRAEAMERTAPVRVIARAVVGLSDDEMSVERLTRRIEQWVARGQLVRAGTKVIDRKPRPVYRIGDVFDLLSGDVLPKNAGAC